MANKKVSQLVSKPSVLVTDLFPIADPTTGQLFKTTISDLGTAIGSGVSSVNTLVGAVVLDTDDIQELASPTNRWFTDTRARAALSASSPLAYNSGTGVFSIAQANGSTNGFLSSTDWTTFNAKQAALSGTGFVKISGTTISYDNSTYLTTSAAASTYLALAGGTLTGALNGTSATFTGDLTLSASNPRLYFTDTDNNPDYFISNTDGTFTIYDVTNSTSRFTIGTTGNGTFGGNLTVGQIIRSGGTSAQFLKADGSVDSSTYALDSAVVKLAGTQTITGDKAFTLAPTFDAGAGFKNPSGLYNYISATDTGWKMPVNFNKEHIFVLNTSTAYTYTFPSATGTLALTSDLSAYLPLSGGTLTGALSGTSATFNGDVGVVKSSPGYFLQNSTSITSGSRGDLSWYNSSVSTVALIRANALTDNVGTQLEFYTRPVAGSLTQVFTIASTGAATFSSSVSATSVALNGSIANSGDAATLTIKQTSTSYNNGIYLERGGERNGYHIYIGGASDSLTFRRNYFGTQGDVMSLTRDGNVGIGTTSPSQSLDVSKAGVNAIRVINTANASDAYYIAANTAGSAFFGINSTGPYIYTASALDFTLLTNNTERMRITSGGFLKAKGNESTYFNPGLYHELRTGSGDEWTAVITNTASSPYGLNLRFPGASPNGTSNYFIECTDSTTNRFRISSNGNVTNTNGSYGTISDFRLKENIVDATPKLADLLAVKIKNFNLIGEETKQIGVIAQELEEVFPSMVETDGKTGMKQVKTSIFIPMLIKAIQEQQAQIEELKNK